VSLTELVDTLWRQREALELLLFKLEEEQLVLASGSDRWHRHAGREVELVLEQIRHTEVLRAMESDDTAAALGLPPGVSLSAMSAAAPEPWAGMLRAHRAAFLLLTVEIGGLARTDRRPAQPAYQAALAATIRAVQPALADYLR
jgi:hypothetical protein